MAWGGYFAKTLAYLEIIHYLCTRFGKLLHITTYKRSKLKIRRRVGIIKLQFMKRLFFSLAVLLFATTSMAQNQEIGLVVGGLNGLSYKKHMSENFAIQTDLAVGFQSTQLGLMGDGDYIPLQTDIFDFILNPNFLYHKDLKYGVYVEFGGGVSAGLMQTLRTINPATLGKFGINAMAAVGYTMDKLPLAFGLDFRPGYAMSINVPMELLINQFDWHLAASVRYCF